MTPAQFGDASSLFLRARALDAGERDAAIDACDDPEVRAAVRGWLAADTDDHPLERGLDAGVAAEALRAHAADDARPMPEHIGRYRVVRRIGEGGMGTVYEARQHGPDRLVAIKLLRPGMVTARMMQRFHLEAQVLGRLRHPGIAQIYEAGTTADGQPYFAMELVEGLPLLEFAHAHDLSTRQRLELVAQICDALQHAHDRGVIHRDLKPANVLVEAGVDASGGVGRPRVLDFGVARVTDMDVQAATLRTGIGEVVGTVPYMSPEQASGDPALIDVRSEVYALGVILFELLTGRLPYDLGGRLVHEQLRIIREQEPTRLGSTDRGLRGDVETIVATALEKDPARRYPSVAALGADLRRQLEGRPIEARPTSALYQLRKFAARNRGLSAGIALAFAAMTLATGLSSWSAHRLRVAEAEAQRLRLAAERKAYQATIAAAELATRSDDPRSARRLLLEVAPAERGWEWRHLAARLDTSAVLVSVEAPPLAAGVADDGTIVLVDAQGDVRRFDASGAAREGALHLDPRPVAPATIGADGRRLVAGIASAPGRAGAWDLERGVLLSSRDLAGGEARSTATSADGGLAVVAHRSGVAIWRPGAPDGGLDVRAGERIQAVALAGDGTVGAIAYEGASIGQGYVLAFDARTGRHAVQAYRYPDLDIRGVALDDDGSFAALAGGDKSVRLFDVRRQRPARELVGHTARVNAVAIERGGRRVASGSDDTTVRIWDPTTGATLQTCLGHDGPIEAVAFVPGGRRAMALAGRAVRLWDMLPRGDDRILRGHESYVYGVAFADDNVVLSVSWDATVRAWSVADMAAIGTHPSASKVLAVATCAGSAPRDGAAAPSIAIAGRVVGVATWDGAAMGPIQPMEEAEDGDFVDLDFDAGGTRLAGRAHDAVVVWDMPSRRVLRRAPSRSATSFGAVAISPDGRRLAIDGPGAAITILDATSGRSLRQLAGSPRPIVALDFSPDGRTLASGGQDHVVRLWDVETGAPIANLEAHTGSVFALAFSPDGARLASGSDDTTIRIWNPRTGAELLSLSGHEDYVYDLAFSPDGSCLASASGDGTARLWDTLPRHARRRRPVPPTGSSALDGDDEPAHPAPPGG